MAELVTDADFEDDDEAVEVEEVEIPDPLLHVFEEPLGSLRYRGAYGGRGSGKSYNFAKMAALFGSNEPLRILCARDIQASIAESFYAELKNAIESTPWLAPLYDIKKDKIEGYNGTKFFFRGLRHNMSNIKSIAQVNLCIVEEAEDVGEDSWVDLIPSIRHPGSEIWVIWNPKKLGSATDKRFRQHTPPRSRIVELQYYDNPWFPGVLEETRLDDKEVLPYELYTHIWLGAYYQHTDAQIFAGRYDVEEFTPGNDWNGPYCGLDFGFSQDPTAGVKCWVHDNVLYIEYDAGKTQLDIDDTAEYFRKMIPGYNEQPISADSARPESISYLKKNGMPKIRAVEKWPNSVVEGIEFIKSFKRVVIHPRCKETKNEFELYSYKVDRLTKEVTTDIVDKYNHYIDAIRYALFKMIRQKTEPRVRSL